MIEVRKVATKKEQKEFIEFPLNLYKNNPYFVPPLYIDEKKLFKNDFYYNDQCETIYFNAYDEGKIVGRISAILQKAANLKWKQKRVRFTRFDSIDDQKVAHALFAAVKDFALEKGMDTICGPLGFSDLEREGLLVDGFDELATFEEQYNFPYYEKLILNEGFIMEVEWNERQLRPMPKDYERYQKLAASMLKKYNLHIGQAKNTKEFLAKYANDFFEILDKTYVDIYQTVPFSESMKKTMISNFNLIIDVKHVSVILDANNKVVCFGLTFPSIAKAVQKSKGHLTIPALLRILKAIKHPKIIDLGLIGVLPEYAMKGIATTLIVEVNKMLLGKDVEYAETNLNLVDNIAIQNQWKPFDSTIHKIRRAYTKIVK